MIRKGQLDGLLRGAVPSLGDQWAEAVTDEVGDDGGRLHYLTAGSVSRHVVELYQAGDLAAVQAAFDFIERLHLQGDDYVRELATVGYLEGVQIAAGHADIDQSEFEPFLGPESERWWRGVTAFWEQGAIPIRPVD